MEEVKEKPTRQTSIELLRSVAMLMVITLHYLGKSGIMIPLSEKQSLDGYMEWLLEAFCIVAVNTYMLISGYFLTVSGFKLKRFILLTAQILFYSILIPLLLPISGRYSLSELTLHDFLLYFLPIEMNHYWFGTAYLLMYLFVPILSSGVKQISEKQLRVTIFLAVLVFSIGKSVLPFQLAIDNAGYDMVWFLVLFLLAAYFRLYGCKWLSRSRNGWFLYLGGSVSIFLLSVIIAYFSRKFGKFEYFIESPYDYNHILCLLAAIGLFFAFLHWEIPEGFFAKVVRWIAPYTFGVYLLHEHMAVKYRLPKVLGTKKRVEGGFSPLHWLASIFLIFIVGILVDYIRSLIFSKIEKAILKVKLKKTGEQDK